MRLPRPAKKLPIRTRRTLAGDGLRAFEDTVWCELRERSLAVDECLGCTHCTYVTFASNEGAYLLCDREGASAPRVEEPTVGSVMTRVVQCVRSDTTIESVAALLLECGIGGAPVVDGQGRAIGMISKTDVVRCLHERRDPSVTTVGDVMMTMVFALHEDAPLARAAALMAYEGVHRIPIVATDGVLVGVITPLDVARAYGRTAMTELEVE